MIRPWSAGSDAESLVPSITERRSSTQSPSGLFGSRLLSKANRRPESRGQIKNYVRERTDGYSKVTNARIDWVASWTRLWRSRLLGALVRTLHIGVANHDREELVRTAWRRLRRCCSS